jgi:aldehyde:ferredoxin oxidoreductase
MLKHHFGGTARVVACGPAAENMVPIASLLADGDASGSNGFGAVMGSKRLKAIVVKGDNTVTVADPEGFLDICKYLSSVIDIEKKRLARLSSEVMSGYASKMKRDVCYGCIGACTRMIYEAKNGTRGKFACGAATFYGSLAGCYYGDWNDIPFFATKLCDSYGLDTEVVFCLSMWLRRCFEAGTLSDESTSLPLSKIGSYEFIDTLVKRISQREGFGEILAQGVRRAAELVGMETTRFITDYTSKDDRPMLYCPRMYIVAALLYALEPRIPIQQLHEMGFVLRDWLQWVNKAEGAYLSSDVFLEISVKFWGSELAVDFSTYEGKALAAVRIQNRQYAKESLILCDWMWPIISNSYSDDHVDDPALESKLISTVLGRKINEDELYKFGDRIFNLQRAISVREGHRGSEDDQLPEAMFTFPSNS